MRTLLRASLTRTFYLRIRHGARITVLRGTRVRIARGAKISVASGGRLVLGHGTLSGAPCALATGNPARVTRHDVAWRL